MHSRKPSVIIPQDLPFHRRQWLVQRIGWAVALAVLALGMLGLFGDGPLSHMTAGSPALRLEYQRFIRRDDPARIHVEALPDAGGHEVALAVSGDYLRALRIESVLPQPERVETTGPDVVFVFRVTPSTAPVRITFDATPLSVGGLHGRVSVVGRPATPSVPIDQFSFP